jgi:hypothetical protein
MPERRETRLLVALPVRVYGIGSDGKAFVQEAITVDIANNGARVRGVDQLRTAGEIVGVQYETAKGRFKVVWIGEEGTDKQGQIGLLKLDLGDPPWMPLLNQPVVQAGWTDGSQGRSSTGDRVPLQVADSGKEEIAERVAQTTVDLKQVEGLIGSGTVDPRILREFREALNHVRQTSWAVQKWLELQGQKQDPYSAMEILVAERIRCATQLSRELASDIESQDVSFDTTGVPQLRNELDNLSRLLSRIAGAR